MAAPTTSVESEPSPVGAIMCGGRSSRFGTDKALAMAGDRSVGQRIVSALRAGGVDPVVAIGGAAGGALAIPTIPDLRPGDGPLGALATALLWAKTGSVIVVPCDLPLLTGDHIELLRAAAVGHRDEIVVATVGGKPQVSLTLWPAAHGRDVLRLLDDGARRFRSALDVGTWRGVEVPAAAVRDADTPEDLARLFR